MNTLPRCTHLSSLAGAIITLLVVAAPGPCAAQTAVLTVGPHGGYPTIEGALGNIVDGWVNEVRVEPGVYVENVLIEDDTVALTHGALHVSGGWNSTFSSQTADPNLTTIDGHNQASCLRIYLNASAPITITVSNLALRYGNTDSGGGGVHFTTWGNVRLDMVDTVVADNITTYRGAGLYAFMYGDGNRVSATRTTFHENRAYDMGGFPIGGGAYVYSSGLSAIEFDDVWFDKNGIEDLDLQRGVGLHVDTYDGSVLSIVDCRFDLNGTFQVAGTPDESGSALYAFLNDSWTTLRRLSVIRNRSHQGNGSQVEVRANGDSLVRIGEILAIEGHDGLELIVNDTATIQATNVTSAYNSGVGLALDALSPTATGTIHNSIFFGNDVNFNASGPVTGGHLLDGVDPLFIDPGLRNYRLGPGSPAANAGTNSPAAGLGDADLDGGVRVLDGLVDIGAYEGVGVLFSDAFATRDTHRWTATVGAAP